MPTDEPATLLMSRVLRPPLDDVWSIRMEQKDLRNKVSESVFVQFRALEMVVWFPPSPAGNSLRPVGYSLKPSTSQRIQASRTEIWLRALRIHPFARSNRCFVTPGSIAVLCHTPLPEVRQTAVIKDLFLFCCGCAYLLQYLPFGRKLVSPISRLSGSPYSTETTHDTCARTMVCERQLPIGPTPTHMLKTLGTRG